MARPTLEEFLSNRNLLAIKISSSDLAGFFRKSIRVPLNTTGLALFADGACSLFLAGQEVSGKFDLTLAKHGEIQLRLAFPDLRSSDGFPVAAAATVAVELSLARADLFRDFCRNLFNFPGTYGAADLKNHLAGELRRALASFAAGRPAAEIHRADLAGPVGELLKGSLERFLFDAGVRYDRLLELSLRSAEYEQRAEAEKKRAEDELRSAQVLEKREERLRRLAGILKDQDVQGLLTRVPDERLKGLLYAKLMEDDAVQITAEELLSKAKDCGEEVVQVIYKAMEGLLSNGASVGADEVESSTADRIFLAAGARVLELDPGSDEKPRVHAFREPLRSVRYVDSPQGAFLAGGSKRNVFTLPVTPEGGEVKEYPLPNGRPVRGGVNSIAFDGNHLYATHSEYGLAAWPVKSPGEPPDFLFEEITKPNKTTRAVQTDGRGAILFASGSHVYSGFPSSGPPAKYVSSVESPVTCIAVAARTIFAGTENGCIVCWKLDAPDQPVVLVRKRDAIVNLRLAKICAIPHLIYSTRDLSVRARVIGQNLETSYESDGAAVGVLDAASDLICASDAEGRRVLLWKSTAPSRPAREVEVWKQSDKPVLDIWMKKVRAKSA
jgi:hypothetical protein